MTEVRVSESILTDVEWYIPRSFIARVEGDRVILNRPIAELRTLELSTPPALHDRA